MERVEHVKCVEGDLRWITTSFDRQMSQNDLDGSHLDAKLLTPLHPLSIECSITKHALHAEISLKGATSCEWAPASNLHN